MTKPIIGITSSYIKQGMYMEGTYVHHDYQKAIVEAGGVPIVLPVAPSDVLDRYVDMCDGFIFSGGEDVDPRFYNEDPHPKLGFFYTERDESELYLIKKVVEKKKPVFAICRGIQLLNVALGGTVIQDIPSQRKSAMQHSQTIQRDKTSHVVQINEDSKLHQLLNRETVMVNSLHHQAINQLAEGLITTATARDGMIEAVELEGNPFVMGIQWHPESMVRKDKTMMVLFEEFVREAGSSTKS